MLFFFWRPLLSCFKLNSLLKRYDNFLLACLWIYHNFFEKQQQLAIACDVGIAADKTDAR